MLDQVSGRVTAFIVAPPELADHFDAHGCLIPAKWCDYNVPLSDDQIRQVEGPAEQAEAMTDWLAELGGEFRSDEISIGVPDEALVPHLQRQLKQCDIPARWVEHVRLAETAPFRLLAAATQFAGPRRYEDLASLLRHPDIESWLGTTLPPPQTVAATPLVQSLPAQLDRFYNAQLPSRIRASAIAENAPDWPQLSAAVARIEDWLADASSPQSLRLGDCFGRILGTIYGNRSLCLDTPADDVLHRTLCRILEECDSLCDIPESLDSPKFSAADAFQLIMEPLTKEALPPPADSKAVEILGWLELPLDDSRALLVTSFNEGFVPQSTGADAFLPDRLRRELGVFHNQPATPAMHTPQPSSVIPETTCEF